MAETALTEDVIGRDEELGRIRRFVDALPHGPAGLVLEGEPGIGKTTLWKWACSAAARCAYRVLSSRPAESEASLSFAGISDLLDGALDEVLPSLHPPQARALEVALLRTEPEDRAPDQRAVSVAALEAFRSLSRRDPLLLAVDDVQWLDTPSARVLEFVLRRLESDATGVLLAVRLEALDRRGHRLENAMSEERIEHLRVGPLTVAGLHRLIQSRLGVALSRPMLLRVHEASAGNPFFALEMVRTLRGTEPDPRREAGPLPVPDSLRQLVEQRLVRLPARTLDLLLVAAALSQPTERLVSLGAPDPGRAERDLTLAVAAGIIELDGGRVRFSHPLLSSTLYWRASPAKRRVLHGRLASVVSDPEERARHLALAARGPEASVAEAVDEAARRARSRGAPEAAAELSEQASGLTPPSAVEDRHRRVLAAADHHFVAGDTARARALLEDLALKAPHGPFRGRVLLDLGRIEYYEGSAASAVLLGEQALGEVEDDSILRSQIEQALAWRWAMKGNMPKAVQHADAAVEVAEGIEDLALLAGALSASGFFRFFLGTVPWKDSIDRALELEGRTKELIVDELPGSTFSVILKYVDEFDRSRSMTESLCRQAFERGEEGSLPILLYHLSELEAWAGNWEAAERHVRDGYDAAVLTGQHPRFAPALRYALSVVQALRGRSGPAREAAVEGIAFAEACGALMFEVRNRSVLGFLALSDGDPVEAHRHLAPLQDLVDSMGIGEPGVFRFLPDEIEALSSIGEVDHAEALVAWLEERGHALDRPWARATAARCRAIIAATHGDPEGALLDLERALVEHERLPMPFELGRTLLVKGQVERRAKQKRASKESLEQALSIFERLGAPLWAEKARADLRRVGLRPSTPFDLTETEQRVADLAAAGRTNRQIAEALFVSPKTVEANLSRVYRKLGVGSKAELAAAVASGRAAGAHS